MCEAGWIGLRCRPDIRIGAGIGNGSTYRASAFVSSSTTQVRFRIPHALAFAGASSDVVTIKGDQVVFTLGYLAVGTEQTVTIPMSVASNVGPHEVLRARAHLYSSTALPVETNAVFTNVR